MATWADCAGCGKRAEVIESGTNENIGVFDMTAESWNSIYVPQNNEAGMANLSEAGGTAAILARLRTSEKHGIDGTAKDIENRIQQFGRNKFPEPPFESK